MNDRHAISEIAPNPALRDKLSDTETRDLIEYVKTTRQEAKDEIKADKSLATKEVIASLRNASKDDITSLRAEMAASKSATREDIANLKTEIERGLKEQFKGLIVLLTGFSRLISIGIELL